jgi:pyruvate kinase
MRSGKTPSDKADMFSLGLTHKYLYFRRTKIVATMARLIIPAMIARLSGKVSTWRASTFPRQGGGPSPHDALIRKIARGLGVPVAVHGYLSGPKIRVGRFKGDAVQLKEGSIVTITTEPVLGDATLIPCPYKRLAAEVRPGEQVLLDDGNLELKVLGKAGGRIRAKVLRGGILRNNKGMNLPDTVLSLP